MFLSKFFPNFVGKNCRGLLQKFRFFVKYSPMLGRRQTHAPGRRQTDSQGVGWFLERRCAIKQC